MRSSLGPAFILIGRHSSGSPHGALPDMGNGCVSSPRRPGWWGTGRDWSWWPPCRSRWLPEELEEVSHASCRGDGGCDNGSSIALVAQRAGDTTASRSPLPPQNHLQAASPASAAPPKPARLKKPAPETTQESMVWPKGRLARGVSPDFRNRCLQRAKKLRRAPFSGHLQHNKSRSATPPR